MRFPALLLRCLLAVALVASGVPAFGMASDGAPHEAATAMTSCHDMAAPEQTVPDHGAKADADADCCGSADCLCDCLQHTPAAALALPTLATPVFPAAAPSLHAIQRRSRADATTLRPPIG